VKKSLESLLDSAALLALAGDVIYPRREDYQRSGVVLDVKLASDKLQAQTPAGQKAAQQSGF
jgi:hypothetical protein